MAFADRPGTMRLLAASMPWRPVIHRVPGDYISYKCVWDPPGVVRYRGSR